MPCQWKTSLRGYQIFTDYQLNRLSIQFFLRNDYGFYIQRAGVMDCYLCESLSVSLLYPLLLSQTFPLLFLLLIVRTEELCSMRLVSVLLISLEISVRRKSPLSLLHHSSNDSVKSVRMEVLLEWIISVFVPMDGEEHSVNSVWNPPSLILSPISFSLSAVCSEPGLPPTFGYHVDMAFLVEVTKSGVNQVGWRWKKERGGREWLQIKELIDQLPGLIRDITSQHGDWIDRLVLIGYDSKGKRRYKKEDEWMI